MEENKSLQTTEAQVQEQAQSLVKEAEGKSMTAKELIAQVQIIQQVKEAVMIKDVHYGIIPGSQKPTLLKPGAEKLAMVFGLVCEPEVDDLSTPGENIRYRIKTRITSRHNGKLLGYGVGEASSDETKYKWRRSVSDAEFEATLADRKNIKYMRNETIKQIRTEFADQANTILKMAKKRSLVDAVLTTTAASDFFNQDLEDMEHPLEETKPNGKPITSAPISSQAISVDGEMKMIELMEAMNWSKRKIELSIQRAHIVGEKAALDAIEKEYNKFKEEIKPAQNGELL
jgi:hypothetical protein